MLLSKGFVGKKGTYLQWVLNMLFVLFDAIQEYKKDVQDSLFCIIFYPGLHLRLMSRRDN